MTTPLKIEVTEAMLGAVLMAPYGEGDVSDMLRGGGDEETAIIRAALTAAFQHPEFVRRIREQVMGCVPEATKAEAHGPIAWAAIDSWNRCVHDARASLGRLLGEEG